MGEIGMEASITVEAWKVGAGPAFLRSGLLTYPGR